MKKSIINNRLRGTWMNISKLASTVIMATSIATLFLFTMIFYVYGADQNALEKAFSITSGFFGGIATLVAAYIATQLFNDWKDQHNKNIDSQFCMKIYDFIDNANLDLIQISGFLKDYFKTPNTEKIKHNDALKLNARKLLNLKDSSLISLSNIGYFINEKEYNEKYVPQILAIDENLQFYIDLYQHHLVSNYIGDLSQVEQKIDSLMLDTRKRYQAFIIELSRYYKA